MSSEPSGSLVGQFVDGRYEVQRELGAGGMGEVYLAVDRRTGRPVAIKLPWPWLLGQAPEKERFLQEIRALSRLDHPHIVKVLDVVECVGRPAQVLQYFSGGTLEQRDDLPLDCWLPDIAAALDYLHGEGLVHRDVKPANILLDSQSTACLGDFGIAKLLAGSPKLTQTGYAPGTPTYMAPEAIQGQELDGRADQYALAMIVYERLAGRLPFEADTPWGLAAAHVTSPPLRLSEVDGRYGEETNAALAGALSKDAAERFASCREFAEALLRSLNPPDPGSLVESEPIPPPSEPTPPPFPATVPGGGSDRDPTTANASHEDTCNEIDRLHVLQPARSWWSRVVGPEIIVGVGALLLTLGLFVMFGPGIAAKKSQQETIAGVRESLTSAQRAVGDVEVNSIGMVLVPIPAGSFLMGSPGGEADRSNDEGPQHRVQITKPFYLGVYEVTQAQYEAVIGKNPSRFKGRDLPVESVSWVEATEFCRELSARENRTYRLPTEAEWEYACRTWTETRFAFGETLSSDLDANFNNNIPYGAGSIGRYAAQTMPVGSYRRNAWGLHDMHGNVWEWCADWYDADYYTTLPSVDPMGAATGSVRVLRGGSWSSPASFGRSADRFRNHPLNRYSNLGFRVAFVLPSK